MSINARSVHVVELRDVSRSFKSGSTEIIALDRVSLTLPAGELIAVVGRSGSGKSTLMNLVAGIDHPTRGEVVVAGKAVQTMDESSLAAWRGRNVGVVFQFFQLLPTLSVLENVMLPMDFCGTLAPAQAKRRALELLDQMGIGDQAGKLPSTLSGGQQQRAAIARALANDPPLILADEPTGNLDSHTAGLVVELLAGLAEAGKTVVMVTHERDVARLVDRVVTLVDGRVVTPDAKGEAAHA